MGGPLCKLSPPMRPATPSSARLARPSRRAVTARAERTE